MQEAIASNLKIKCRQRLVNLKHDIFGDLNKLMCDLLTVSKGIRVLLESEKLLMILQSSPFGLHKNTIVEFYYDMAYT